jgi:AmiR/NasT family two-component response regulator
MTEPKIRWRAKYDALVVEHEQTKKELSESLSGAISLASENDALRAQLDDLRKEVERARIQGMHDATGLILRESANGG